MTKIIDSIKSALQGIYPPTEIKGLIRIIMEDVFQIPPHHYLMNMGRALTPEEHEQLEQIIARLKQHEPIQYILGKAPFCGLELDVNSSTLIPRPETTELIEWITHEHQPANLRILDIGTGTGCIAIALAKAFPNASLFALDISEETLRTATHNAEKNEVQISFLQADILQFEKLVEQFDAPLDLIVSNPPYICLAEKKEMEKHVLDFEPHGALFVPDDDPLLFYRQIAKFGLETLTQGGSLYFEINRAYGKETQEMLEQLGYQNVICRKDLAGNDRMIKATR